MGGMRAKGWRWRLGGGQSDTLRPSGVCGQELGQSRVHRKAKDLRSSGERGKGRWWWMSIEFPFCEEGQLPPSVSEQYEHA